MKKVVVARHRRRKAFGTFGTVGLIGVGWVGLGVIPATSPVAAPAQDAQQGSQGKQTVQGTLPVLPDDKVDQADSDDLKLAGATRAALLSGATVADIPAPALAAYQRAATVIDGSVKDCHLDWTLLAAIGKVESDHGRAAHRKLAASHPGTTSGIVGVALNGRHHRAVVRDTDGGVLDGDRTWDRAVGPMQFLPSTWSVIAVDGDGDGVRDPQDIDDATLGAAVYLCGAGDDLASQSGVAAAVGRYNHSSSYLALVLSLARTYSTSAPGAVNASGSGVLISNVPTVSTSGHALRPATPSKVSTTKTPVPGTPGAGGGTPSGPSDPSGPTSPTAPAKVVVPAVNGKALDDAVAALGAAGLSQGQVTRVYSSAPRSQVISTNPGSGASLDKGSAVGLTVSLGPIPDVVGKTRADAESILGGLNPGVKVVVIDQAEYSDVPAGQVVSVAHDDQVAAGGTVTLTVSKGPAPADPPASTDPAS